MYFLSALVLLLSIGYSQHQLLELKSERPISIAQKSNYALVLQKNQDDCGAAVLATILLHHRRSYSYQEIRDLLNIDRDRGSSLLSMKKAAEKLGFAARAVKATDNRALLSIPLPAIAHEKSKSGHFIVIHYVDKDSIIIADPANGIQKMSWGSFSHRWSGALLLLEPK
jgi:ATP-binding cassette, subfamily C, bacteriocin exporter